LARLRSSEWLIIAYFCYVALPLVWLVLLPFRLVGIAVAGALHLVWAVVMLPFVVVRRLAPAAGVHAYERRTCTRVRKRLCGRAGALPA
jgi:hypothetical protein